MHIRRSLFIIRSLSPSSCNEWIHRLEQQARPIPSRQSNDPVFLTSVLKPVSAISLSLSLYKTIRHWTYLNFDSFGKSHRYSRSPNWSEYYTAIHTPYLLSYSVTNFSIAKENVVTCDRYSKKIHNRTKNEKKIKTLCFNIFSCLR